MRYLEAIESWLQPGTHVGGYTIDGLLASGGMAKVFVAVQQNLGRRVTLKVLNDELASDPTFAERFQREARIMSELAHPNIVTVYEFFEERDHQFLVMEHVDGFDLDTLLSQVLRLGPEVTLLILVDVARGLREAHAHGLIHRDIKTANLLLSRTGVVKVTDFGIAYGEPRRSPSGTRLTFPGIIVGTPECMAPEQLDGGSPTPAVDMYALGIATFELLTGDVPFHGETPRAIRESMDRTIDLGLELTSGKDALELNELVRSMLALDPLDRLPSMAALEERTQDLLREFDPSGFLFEHRRTILEHVAADPASVCADLSGARATRQGRAKRYRELFADRKTTTSRRHVVSTVADLAGLSGERPRPKTTRAMKRPTEGSKRPWTTLGVATLLLTFASDAGERSSPLRAIETLPGAVVEPSRQVAETPPLVASPPRDPVTRPAVAAAAPSATTREPQPIPPALPTARARLVCGPGAEIFLDDALVATGVFEVEISLAPDTDHRLDVRYPALFTSDVRVLRASASETLVVESGAPRTAPLALACSPPGPATVRFRGYDALLVTPAQFDVGAGSHVIEARREGAVLARAVVTRYQSASTPVTPEVVSAVDGRVEFEVHEGRAQRVILKFEPASKLAKVGANDPPEEVER